LESKPARNQSRRRRPRSASPKNPAVIDKLFLF
jgi:hypothetical protein